MKRVDQIRRIASFVVLALLTVSIGCKKKEEPPQQKIETPAPAAPVVSIDPPSLPQDVFGPEAVPGATALTPVDPHSLSETELKYGVAPRRTSSVEYQPDVIVMEQGDKAIRSIATNGLEWEFDANAEHVSEFQQGKIVFATGRAVGRIISLKKEGGSVKAVLGPIQLTDVIKNGKFKMDAPISADKMISYVAPDFPQEQDANPDDKKSSNDGTDDRQLERATVVSRVQNGVWTPMSVAETYPSGRRVTFQKIRDTWRTPQSSAQGVDPALQLSSYRETSFSALQQLGPIDPGTGLRFAQAPSMQPIPEMPAQTLGTPPVVDVSDLRTVAVANPSYIGLQFYSKKLSGGLGISAEALMYVNGIHMHFVLDIQNGKIITCGIDMGGALGVKLEMKAYTVKDFTVNLHKKWWEPVDLTIPLGLGNTFGIPFSVTFNMMLDVNSGFSAKQSVLEAEGQYTYKGGLWAGYKGGSWTATTATDLKAVTDIGQSTQGVSVGINSLVIAASVRAMVGIGAFGFNTGVFVGMRFDGTMLRAPDIALPCRQGTIEVFIDSGVGYSLPGFVIDVLNKLLSVFTSYQIEKAGTLLKGPSYRLFHGDTQIPSSCASPKQGAGGSS